MLVEQRLFNLTTELQSISGKNDKITFIKENSNDSEFLKYLSILLNKLVVFGIQTKKLDKALNIVDSSDCNPISDKIITIFNLFEYLEKNNTGTDEDALIVAAFIHSLPKELQKWASASITKTLKLGVTAKSVNKALGYNLIVEFNVQRGKSFSDEAHKFAKDEKIVSEKFNGIRGICEVTNGKPVFKSRQNQVFKGLLDLEKAMQGYPDGVYEGELIVKNRHQYKLRQVLQETMKILSSDDEDKKLDWILFDYLTHDEFAEPETSRSYFQRKEDMYQMDLENADVHIAPTLYKGTSNQAIYDLLEEVVARGGEGLMVNLDKPYKKDKTNHILKVKKKYTSDLRVIGFEEGKSTGKYAGTLGSLIVEYKGNKVNVSGMSDSERKEIWENQDKYLNAIVEVEHEQETSNEKNDLLSLEYPNFVQWRFDKDEHSYAHGDD